MKKILFLLFFITSFTFAKGYSPPKHSYRLRALELYRRQARSRNIARLERLRSQIFSPLPQGGGLIVRQMGEHEVARRSENTSVNPPLLTFGDTRINWT